jgi:hypothetical protein
MTSGQSDVELVQRLAETIGMPLLEGDASRVAEILAGQLQRLREADALAVLDLSCADTNTDFEVSW